MTSDAAAAPPQSIVGSHDARLGTAPLGQVQIGVFVVALLICCADGYDNQALAFTVSSMAGEWKLPVTAFVTAFGAGTAGQLIGAIGFGLLADRLGRRPAFLIATALFGLATLATPFVTDVAMLTMARFVGGLGIGGVPPVLAATISEFAPERHRAQFINWAFAGIPLGGFVGGVLSALLLPVAGWHAIYWIGGVATIGILAIAYFKLPESLFFLSSRRGNAARIAALSERLGLPAEPPPVDPEAAATHRPGTVADLFASGWWRATLLFWVAEFIMLMTFYFLVNWIPTLLQGLRLSLSTALYGSAALNLGAVASALIMGRLCLRFGVRAVATSAFVATAGSLVLLSAAGSSALLVLAGAVLAGASCIAGQSVMVLYMTTRYAPAIRSTGVGFAVAIGRVGSIASPFVVGGLMVAGWGTREILLVPVIPALIGGLCVYLVGVERAGVAP
jgi:AAHS family 4-hydroxybenzoate transporter-like MFS transporter